MQDGQCLGATWGTHSDLPHRCRERCHFSLADGQKSPRDAFPQELSHLDVPNFLGVNVLLIIHDGIFWDVGRGFLRFRQRADPLVVIELFRGWVLFLLQENELPETTTSSWPSPASGDDGTEMFLPFSVDVPRLRRDICLPAPLAPSLPRSAPVCIAILSRRFGPHGHFLQWWDESQCPSSVERELWSSSSGSQLNPAQHHPPSLFMALLMDPLAVKAQARASRAVHPSAAASSHVVSCEADQSVCCPDIFETKLTDLPRLHHAEVAVSARSFLSTPFGISARSKRHL